jgi:hypothetical protein
LRCNFREGDEIIPDPEDEFDEPQGLNGFENPAEGVDDPLDFEDFKHEIDSCGGYMLDYAKDMVDFERELIKARDKEEVHKTEARKLMDHKVWIHEFILMSVNM